MMKEFMKTHSVFLTPLSPIHIGCGEDFEPTNYVIDNNVLYHFDPSNLYLSQEKRNELLNKVNTLKLLEIQRFFLKNKEDAITFSHYFANVPQDIENKWKDKIGNVVQNEKEKDVINKLAIERTAYLPYQHNVYIPGSSFKGAVVTAFLDSENRKSNQRRTSSKSLHKELLKEYIGEFNQSKFRTVKFSDFIPQYNIHSQVYYALNYKKDPAAKGKGISLRRESILAGQYRAFKSDLSLWENRDNTLTVQQYFKMLNDYYQPIFDKECEILLTNRFISKEWVKQIKALLVDNSVALVRLGKNGSDSKVYSDKNLPQIRIMKGKGKKLAEFKNASTTVWLAGVQETQVTNLQPFGWAILELDQKSENEVLKQWCEQQIKPNFDRNTILAKREMRERERQQQIEMEKAKQEEILLAEAKKQAMLNSLNEFQKMVINFVDEVNNTRELQSDTTGSSILKNFNQLVEKALDWNIEDKAFFIEKITVELIKSKVKFNKKDTEKNLKKLLNKLSHLA